MLDNDLKVIDGTEAGAWIEPRLGGEFGAVTLQVPRGYENYARIFHRASDREGKPVSWSHVAELLGTTAHRAMQWHAVVGCADPDALPSPKWPGEPMVGELDHTQLDTLCEILIAHTDEPERCFFGLCSILGWVEEVLPPEKLGQPRLELPMGRDHIVLQGPLSAVGQIGAKAPFGLSLTLVADGVDPRERAGISEHEIRCSPSLIWPGNRSWFVASEVDFDSTLVGGSPALIDAIVRSPELEAWIVEPDDSLACDADKINDVDA